MRACGEAQGPCREPRCPPAKLCRWGEKERERIELRTRLHSAPCCTRPPQRAPLPRQLQAPALQPHPGGAGRGARLPRRVWRAHGARHAAPQAAVRARLPLRAALLRHQVWGRGWGWARGGPHVYHCAPRFCVTRCEGGSACRVWAWRRARAPRFCVTRCGVVGAGCTGAQVARRAPVVVVGCLATHAPCRCLTTHAPRCRARHACLHAAPPPPTPPSTPHASRASNASRWWTR